MSTLPRKFFSDMPLARLLLQFAHFGINAALCKQFFGASLLGDFAVFQKNELIRALHRAGR